MALGMKGLMREIIGHSVEAPFYAHLYSFIKGAPRI